MISRRLSSVLLIALALAMLAGCSSVRERSFKISDDWSRGNRIGITSIRQPVALAADNDGAYLVWPVKTEDATRLEFVRLGPDGLLVTDTTLALSTIFPQSPQLLVGDDLHLFLVTRVVSGQLNGAYHVALSRDGQVLGEPQRLSGEDQKIGEIVARQSPNGDMHVLWDVVEGPGVGVYHARLDPDGALVGFPQLVGPDGHRPAAQFGPDGASAHGLDAAGRRGPPGHLLRDSPRWAKQSAASRCVSPIRALPRPTSRRRPRWRWTIPACRLSGRWSIAPD